MAETRQSYAITFPDGQSKTITGPRELTQKELSQLTQYYAAQAGLDPGNVRIAPVGETPKALEVPSWQRMVTTLGEAAPYAALGFAPEAAPAAWAARGGMHALSRFLTAHPTAVGRVLRSLGASGIGATEAAVKGEDIGSEATKSGVLQAGLEGVLGPGVRLGARLGGRAMRKLEDSVVGQLMTLLKDKVSWLRTLRESHEGLQDLIVRGEGPAILSKHYGGMLQKVKSSVPETDQMALSVEDAKALKIQSSKIEPMLPPQYAGKRISIEEAQALGLPVTQVNVPVHSVIDHVQGVWKTNPALSHRTLEAIDTVLPDIEAAEFKEGRRLFREGTTMIQSLKAMGAFDEGTKRLNVERLSIGADAMMGGPGKAGRSIWEQTAAKAPETANILKTVIPKGHAPHAKEFPGLYIPLLGHIGVRASPGRETASAVLKKLQPSNIAYSENIPLTAGERKVQRLTPSLVHAGAKALLPEAIP